MTISNSNLDEFDKDDRDDLDALIAECDQRDPGFAALVEKKLRERLAAHAHGNDQDDVAPPEESTMARAE